MLLTIYTVMDMKHKEPPAAVSTLPASFPGIKSLRSLIADQAGRIRHARSRRNTSDPMIDLLRTYGILCVVYAHCFLHGFRLFGTGLISSAYVIQLFVFCSGYLYRTDQDTSPALPFLIASAKSYLLPFFLWNLFYGMVGWFLRSCGMISFGAPLTIKTLFLWPWISNEQFMLNLPSWFLLSLYIVVLSSWLLRRVLHRLLAIGPHAELGLTVFLLILGGFAVWFSGTEEHRGLEVILLRLMILLPYFQLGIVYRASRRKLPGWLGVPVAAIGLCLTLSLGRTVETKMLYCYVQGNPVMVTCLALCAVLTLAELGSLIKIRSPRLIFLISRNTKYIMLHHLFVLFCIQLSLSLCSRIIPLPGFHAAGFQVSIWYRYGAGVPGLMVLELLLAMSIPIILHLIYEKLVLRLASAL